MYLNLNDLDQQGILAVTNTNEGVASVDQTAPQNTTLYAGQLFPKFSAEQAQAVARQYAGLGSPLNQTNLIQGECKHRLALQV
jgi:hypothetical protein